MKRYLILGLVLALILLSACTFFKPEPIMVTFNDTVSAPEKETQVKIISTSPIIYHISVLGKNGFSPDSITIKPGDTIIWSNYDPAKRIMVIVFHRLDDRWKYENSPKVKPGERYSYLFTQAGEYEFWTTEYGKMGRIEVKEI